jgi:hypothetical protein
MIYHRLIQSEVLFELAYLLSEGKRVVSMCRINKSDNRRNHGCNRRNHGWKLDQVNPMFEFKFGLSNLHGCELSLASPSL